MSSIPLISTRSIRKVYGSSVALDDVSLDIMPGEILSLLGVNGAGKTTLSSIIASIKRPTSGDVLWKGVSIYADLEAYRHAIGVCPQRPNLNNLLTCRENLYYIAKCYGLTDTLVNERIQLMSRKLGLEKYLNAMPATLSGGYKQRFMIARSLLHNPQLVILDEPTVALDPHVRHQLWDIIRSLRDEGVTILLTTHYIDEAEHLSDRVCVLQHGVIRLIDTPANLMSSFSMARLEDVFLELTREQNKTEE